MKSFNESDREHVKHTFAPLYNNDSKILILGSFPSVKSRQNGFYYGHPQNRFWKVISSLFDCEIPQTIEDKKDLILNSKAALWDVIESCDIIGSSDNSIQNVIPNDLNLILSSAKIEKIYANGKTAAKLYEKYSQEFTGKPIITLPSTSPANAAYTLEKLIKSWEQIIDHN